MFKVNLKKSARRHWRCAGAFIVKFENIPHLLFTSSVSIVNFEWVNVSWFNIQIKLRANLDLWLVILMQNKSVEQNG